MSNVGSEGANPPRSGNWKVLLTLGLIRLYQLWREARLKKGVQNAPLDAKSKTQLGTNRKKRS